MSSSSSSSAATSAPPPPSSSTTTNGTILMPRPDESAFRSAAFSRKRSQIQTPDTPMKRNCTPRLLLRNDDETSVLRSPYVNIISPPQHQQHQQQQQCPTPTSMISPLSPTSPTATITALSFSSSPSSSSSSSATASATATSSSSTSASTAAAVSVGGSVISPSTDSSTASMVRTTQNYFTTHFRIVSRLGSGSFGDVFHVANQNNEHFAIKCSRDAYKGLKDRQRRLQEVYNLERIAAHPHCVRMYEAWEQRGYLFIRTELCRRGSLRQRMEEMRNNNESFDETSILDIVLDVLLGLQHVHSQNMAHLDLKPENLLMSDEGVIKIADFGIATQRVHSTHGQEGDSRYMAPELLQSVFSCAADLFSLGIIWLELTTLHYPPDGDEEWEALRAGNANIWPGFDQLPTDVQTLITAMLTRNHEQRITAAACLENPIFQERLQQRRESETTSRRRYINDGRLNMFSAVAARFRNVFNLSSELSQDDNPIDVELTLDRPYLFSGHSDDSMTDHSSPGMDHDLLHMRSSPMQDRAPHDFVLTPPASSVGDSIEEISQGTAVQESDVLTSPLSATSASFPPMPLFLHQHNMSRRRNSLARFTLEANAADNDASTMMSNILADGDRLSFTPRSLTSDFDLEL